MHERTYAVTVGVALTRPPTVQEYRRYILTAESPLTARLVATQWAAATCAMPVYASHPEELLAAYCPLVEGAESGEHLAVTTRINAVEVPADLHGDALTEWLDDNWVSQ